MGRILTAWGLAGLDRDYWEKHSVDIRIRLAAAPYVADWGYALQYPFSLYDIPDAMKADRIEVTESGLDNAANRVTNCSTMTMSILTSVYPSAPWNEASYKKLQIYAEEALDNPDSPIDAAEAVGVGIRVAAFADGRWHLVQGIRKHVVEDGRLTAFSGHAFLVLRVGDLLHVLEATSLPDSSGQKIGPRYKIVTEKQLREQYPKALYLAVLQD